MKTKKFIWDDNKPGIAFRPGTSDEAVIQTILVEGKEYLFPKFSPKMIFDIGANIGVTAIILSMVYPGAKIYCFEPVKENFQLLRENTAHLENVFAFNYGLGRIPEGKAIYQSEDPKNLGGFSTHIPGPEGEKISIEAMDDVCESLGIPDLIKIDCEGAEYDILSSTPGLDKVKWITGELHGVDDFKLLDLLSKDFRIQTSRGFADKVWHFQALAKTWTDFGRDPAPQQTNLLES